MVDGIYTTFALVMGGLSLALLGVVFRLKKSLNKREKEIAKEKEETNRRLYELAILKEIGERAGYSLDVEEVLSIITGSLRQFIDYSAVSYLVLGRGKIKISTYLQVSLAKSFLEEMKNRILSSLQALTEKNIEPGSLEEVVSGAISVGGEREPSKVGSSFNIPLVISGKLAGLLTIASIKPGLYKEEDMTLLYKITAQASNAVTRLQEVVTMEEAKLSRVKEDFTSMIVHELRSPLDGMKKIVELIVSGSVKKSSPKFKDYINMLYQSSSSLLELVNDILDYSKLQAGKFEINPLPGNIAEIVENRMEFYRPLAETRKIKINLFIDQGLPETLLFDPRAIKQVLNNFLSNAIKFTSMEGHIKIISFLFDGSIPAEAEKEIENLPAKIAKADLKIKDKSIVVLVSDDGSGIRETQMDDLFKTYKQLDSGNVLDMKGTGLGLAIAKGIVESHKGLIGAVSNEGLGSTFFFAIPLK